jgi:hypothetical protein
LKYWKIEKDIANKLLENKEKGNNIVKGGRSKLAENTMKGKNIMRKGRSKLFEFFLLVYETTMKGSKVFEPYL